MEMLLLFTVYFLQSSPMLQELYNTFGSKQLILIYNELLFLHIISGDSSLEL